MKKLLALMSIVAVLTVVSACTPKKGPAERAGESIDRATSDAADAIEDAGDKIEDTVERSKR